MFENENSGVSLYPNPNTGIFTLSCGTMINNSTIEIIDVVGKLVYKKQYSILSIEQIDIDNMQFVISIFKKNKNQIDITTSMPNVLKGFSLMYKLYKLVVNDVKYFTSNKRIFAKKRKCFGIGICNWHFKFLFFIKGSEC